MIMEKHKIIWLASYPKSGNTWFRAFISNLFSKSEEPVDINNFIGGPIFSAKEIFNEYSAVSSEELTYDEIDSVRADIYVQLSEEFEEDRFIKAHDAYTYLSDGNPLFPTEVSKGAIYLVRNPLDVAISFAHHSNEIVDKTIKKMNRTFSFCSKDVKFHNQLRQQLLNWSEHYLSWKNQTNIPVFILKYEDLKNNPLEHFSKAIEFSGFYFSTEEIKSAIEKASFSKLQEQEKEKGFFEKNPKSKSFFRKGKSGDWREVLTDEQFSSIIEHHREVMQELEYIDKNDNILI
jgi:hypothetical protein